MLQSRIFNMADTSFNIVRGNFQIYKKKMYINFTCILNENLLLLILINLSFLDIFISSLQPIPFKYCKFGNFRKGFIFVKLCICEVSWK